MSLNKPIWNLRNWINKDMITKENVIIHYYLSRNEKAVDFLERNPELINWNGLSLNPNAIKLLEENTDKIDWDIY